MTTRRRLLVWGSLCLALIVNAGLVVSPASRAEENRKLLKKVEPVYPELAQRMNLRGTVKVEITISPSGSVQNVTVLGGNPVLANAVTDAVKQWKYSSSSEETKKTLEFKF
jgi:TonB family protein